MINLPPVLKWIEEISDAWLAVKIRELVANSEYAPNGRDWNYIVAAGMFTRLFHPATMAEIREINAMTMRGEVVPQLIWGRLWARALPKEQVAVMEGHVFRELASMNRFIDILLGKHEEDIGFKFDPTGESWRNIFLDLCHQRDDIDGVRMLLYEAGVIGRILPLLDELDSRGKKLIRLIPRFKIRDEQLKRGFLIDHSAWWAEVAAL